MMKEKTQSDLSIGLIVAPYFLAPVNDNFRLALIALPKLSSPKER
jgi:hypothetical protein